MPHGNSMLFYQRVQLTVLLNAHNTLLLAALWIVTSLFVHVHHVPMTFSKRIIYNCMSFIETYMLEPRQTWFRYDFLAQWQHGEQTQYKNNNIVQGYSLVFGVMYCVFIWYFHFFFKGCPKRRRHSNLPLKCLYVGGGQMAMENCHLWQNHGPICVRLGRLRISPICLSWKNKGHLKNNITKDWFSPVYRIYLMSSFHMKILK